MGKKKGTNKKNFVPFDSLKARKSDTTKENNEKHISTDKETEKTAEVANSKQTETSLEIRAEPIKNNNPKTTEVATDKNDEKCEEQLGENPCNEVLEKVQRSIGIRHNHRNQSIEDNKMKRDRNLLRSDDLTFYPKETSHQNTHYKNETLPQQASNDKRGSYSRRKTFSNNSDRDRSKSKRDGKEFGSSGYEARPTSNYQGGRSYENRNRYFSNRDNFTNSNKQYKGRGYGNPSRNTESNPHDSGNQNSNKYRNNGRSNYNNRSYNISNSEPFSQQNTQQGYVVEDWDETPINNSNMSLGQNLNISSDWDKEFPAQNIAPSNQSDSKSHSRTSSNTTQQSQSRISCSDSPPNWDQNTSADMTTEPNPKMINNDWVQKPLNQNIAPSNVHETLNDSWEQMSLDPKFNDSFVENALPGNIIIKIIETKESNSSLGSDLNVNAKSFKPGGHKSSSEISKPKVIEPIQGSLDSFVIKKSEENSSNKSSKKNSRWDDSSKQVLRDEMGKSEENNSSKSSGNNWRTDDSGKRYGDNQNRRRSSLDFVDKEFFEYKKEFQKNPDFKNISEIEGDLFAMPKEFSLAHCVAEDLRMGSGIAVQFKRDFKSIGDLMNQRQRQGGLALLHDDQNDRYIYYLVTKRISTGKPTYETLWRSLQKMRDHIGDNGVTKLAIPKLGCGLDRLEWTDVKKFIAFLFRDVPVEIVVCNFQQSLDDSYTNSQKDRTCRVVTEYAKHISEIESYTTILYFSSEDDKVSSEMKELQKKFNIIIDFKSKTGKKVGDLIKTVYHKNNMFYILYGCIVMRKDSDEFDFVELENCLAEINKNNRKDGYGYVAFQAINCEKDTLLTEKLITILRNRLKNVDIYVCYKDLESSESKKE